MQIPNDIQVIKICKAGLMKGPASFNRTRRIIYLNGPVFNEFTKAEQDFILCHELGHITTRNEILADLNGFNRFMQLGYTPKQAVEAIKNTLSFTKPQHDQRFLNMILEAAAYDYEKNNNEKSLKIFNMFTPNNILSEKDIDYLRNQVSGFGVNDDDFDNFLGIGKKAKERRDERRDARADRKAAKQSNKNAKAEAKANLINAKAEGIKNGTFKSSAGEIFNSITDTANNIFGGNKNPDADVEDYEITPEEQAAAESKKKMTTYIIIGVVVIAVVAAVIFFATKKKKGGK